MSNKSIIPDKDEMWNLVKATQENLKEVSAELSASRKEMDRRLKEYDKRLEKTRSIFETQWGQLVESLVEGKLVNLLKDRGVEVRQTSQRVEASYTKKDGDTQTKEFDIVVVNGEEVVAVEVKTTLTPGKVKYFLKSLKDFKKYFPDYQSKTVYGAVAYLKSAAEAHLFSQRQGLFVIRATGDSAGIINKKNFKPKAFS